MNRERRSLAARILAMALPAALVGCASGYHYSELTGQRYFTTTLDTFPVAINRVDGESPLVGEPLVKVLPGTHTIEVQGPPTLTNPGEYRSIRLDVKVCTRYYIVAVKQSHIDNNFTPRVDYEMAVPGCTPPPAK